MFNSETHMNKSFPNGDLKILNLYDGELVLDDGMAMPTYLVFDCLVTNRTNHMHLNFR